MGGGKVLAHAAVVDDDGKPVKGVSVAFRKDGKDTGRSVRVDDDGVATKEISLKVGEESLVKVTVVGKPHVTDANLITPEAKKRRATTPAEMILSALFLAIVATASYMAGQVGVFTIGLIGAIVIMVAGGEFMRKIQDNDWIFYMMRRITIFAFLIFLLGLWVDPPELNPVKAIGNQLKQAMSTELKDPWADERWFSFTEGFFDGWGRTSIFFLIWMIIAYPVSFWDDWKAKRKAAEKEGKKSFLKKGLEIFVGEGIGELLWQPIEWLFKKK